MLNPVGGKVKKSWLELFKINKTKHKIHKYELIGLCDKVHPNNHLHTITKLKFEDFE